MRPARRSGARAGRLPRKRSGKRPRPARCVEMLGGIAPKRTFADQMLVQAPERRDTSRDAGGPETAGPQALEVFDDVVRTGPAEAPTMIVQKLGEVGEIAAVGVESIPGRPPLSLKGAEILNDHIGHRVTTSDSIMTLENREGRPSSRAPSSAPARAFPQASSIPPRSRRR